MRITRRLALLVVVPLLTAVAFAALALTNATGEALHAGRLKALMETATHAGDLAYRLRAERASATALLTSDATDAESYASRVAATNSSITHYRAQRSRLSSMPSSVRSVLHRVDRDLKGLHRVRTQVRAGSTPLSPAVFQYRTTIADLITYRDSIAQSSSAGSDVADQIRATAALSKAGEYVGQQQVEVLRALAGGELTSAAQQQIAAARLGYDKSTSTVFNLGEARWRDWLERSVSGETELVAQRMEDSVARTEPSEKLAVSPRSWLTAMDHRSALLRQVDKRTDAAVLDAVTAQRDSQRWWAVGEATLVVLLLAAASVIATRLGRSMTRQLRHLRDAAHSVATTRLPEAVATLSTPGSLGDATPAELAARQGEPARVAGKDEISEVAQAFNTVHHEAVRLAAEQARAHDRFAETLVAAARRGARLTHVMVSELDTVQRDEADPERMETFFALDHLAIRMERNSNNLLVLGGGGHGRVRDSDEPCVNVLMAATQQIERFGRVTFGHVEPDVAVTSRAVDDVAHLLAELLDNATRFSPPGSTVGVAAWRFADRLAVQIVDEGVGMQPAQRAELNNRLTSSTMDVGAVRSMGMLVVARIAARHGIVVELRDPAGTGTITEVTLPSSMLAAVPDKPLHPEPSTVRPSGEASSPAGTSPAGTAGSATGTEPGTVAPPAERGARPHPGEHVAEASPVKEKTAAGLPKRPRQTQHRPQRHHQETSAQAASDKTKQATSSRPEQRRNPRQVSDVLAAYTQGVRKSVDGRTGSPASSARPSGPDDETTTE